MEKENKFLSFIKTFFTVFAVVAVVWYLISSVYDEVKQIIEEKNYIKIIGYIISIVLGVIVFNLMS